MTCTIYRYWVIEAKTTKMLKALTFGAAASMPTKRIAKIAIPIKLIFEEAILSGSVEWRNRSEANIKMIERLDSGN